MKTRIIACLSLSLLLTGAATAQKASLLFAPRQPEFTRYGTANPALSALTTSSIAVVEPGGSSCGYSAHKFVPSAAYQTLFGDVDNDGDVYSPQLLGGIQAVLVKPGEWDAQQTKFVARSRPIDARDIYITPKVAVGTYVSGSPGLRPCDCGTVTADGKIRYFLRGEDIITALGMVENERPLRPDEVSLDAITVGMNGAVYVSFEETHTVQLVCGTLQTYTVEDGAVLVIPPGALTFGLYGNVTRAKPNSGWILFSEAAVDKMVKRAKSASINGNCVPRCIDVDGLALDPRGGTRQLGWCNFVLPVPDLLFTTEASSGAGVLSTRNLGEIARVNGCPLARNCNATGGTTGQQMGLRPSGSVGSLDGLATLFMRPWRFALSTANLQSLDVNSEWYVGTNLNTTSVLLYAGNGTLPISPAWDILAKLGLKTDCFPEVFPNAFVYGPIVVPLKSDGWGGKVGKFSFPVPSSIAPNGLITQVYTLHAGRWQASTPMTFVK